jgi:MSHA biogenesis protein MshN
VPVAGTGQAAPLPDARVLYLDHDSSALGADIVLALTGRPEYVLNVLGDPHRLRLDLRNTQAAGDLAAGFVPAGILSGVRQSAGPEGLTVVFDLTAPVVIDGAELHEGGDHRELRIRLTSLSAVPEALAAPAVAEAEGTAPAPAMVKRPIPRDDAPARDAFRDGIAASRAGDIAGAIDHFYEALSRDPHHLEARRALVALLVEQGDAASAKRLALEGLEAHPADPVLLKSYARLLLEGGDAESAAAILMRSPPALEADPDYYALAAAALQQQGRHPQAAELYARLVRLDGSRGEWWAGLGISLDALGRGAEALKAFRRAQSDAGVPVALRRYVAERVAVLGGGAG